MECLICLFDLWNTTLFAGNSFSIQEARLWDFLTTSRYVPTMAWVDQPAPGLSMVLPPQSVLCEQSAATVYCVL